jgi:hypothetical protein
LPPATLLFRGAIALHTDTTALSAMSREGGVGFFWIQIQSDHLAWLKLKTPQLNNIFTNVSLS